MRDRLLALFAGLLFPLAFAPYGYWPALLVSLAAGVWLLQRSSSGKQAFFRGWLYGFGLFGFGISWVHVSMHDYGYMPLWMAIPATAGFAAFLALFTALSFSLSWRLGKSALAFAGIWLLFDWLRGWVLTGFPWLYAGYGLIDTPLAALAPIGGVWLLTLTALLIAGAMVELVSRRQGAAVTTALAIALIVAALLIPAQPFTRDSGPSQPVALVQGNVPQDIKWQLSMRDRNREIYQQLSADIPADTLVIWPESAMTEFYQDIAGFIDGEGQRLGQQNGALVTGLPWRQRDELGLRYHNSIAVIGAAEDQPTQVYHKQKLVPFGEYVPLNSLIQGLIPFFDLPMYGFSKGEPTQANLTALGHTLAPFICYEILYPALVARRSHDADVLITISNDAWFGTSAGPLQHFQMARMRALETGRWLLRGTNNGVTAVINPAGEVVDALPQFQRDVLYSSYTPRSGTTLFMHTGTWPWLLLAALLVLLGHALRERKGRNALQGWQR